MGMYGGRLGEGQEGQPSKDQGGGEKERGEKPRETEVGNLQGRGGALKNRRIDWYLTD